VDTLSRRRYIISGILILVIAIYVIRLFHLQVLSPVYKQTATNQVVRKLTQYPKRGLIYDRNRELLLYEKPSFDLVVTPREVKSFDTLQLCSLIEVEKDELVSRLREAKNYSPYKPSIIVKQISPEKYAFIQEQLYKYPGFYGQARTVREYPKKIAAHLLGYIGEVSPEVIDQDSYYQIGDYIGISGIEKSYEEELRGEKGIKNLLVDVFGQVKGSYKNGEEDVQAKSGKNLTMTIDAKLQEYAEQLMQNKKGAVVAIEPSTGEILVMLSAPGYDPNLLVGRERGKNYTILLNDPLQPIFDRSIMGQYPPGSTFKMAQALIALQEGVITPATMYACHMGYHVGNYTMKCHHNGSFDLVGAIAHSCNAYFSYVYKDILEDSGYGNVRKAYEAWRDYILSFGLGRKLGTDLYYEKEGLVPTSDYYEKNKFQGSRWRELPINSVAIGQGELALTPLQMANYVSVLANRGYYYIPHVVKQIEGEDSIDARFYVKNEVPIDKRFFDTVIDGMQKVFEEGTGSRSRVNGITMCGKTGTAENPHGANHSVFVMFAPRDNPRIAMSVYVENGTEGAVYAGPIATLIAEKYLTDSISNVRKALESSMLNADLINKGQIIEYHAGEE
jgi:penicillin-binding protein 2